MIIIHPPPVQDLYRFFVALFPAFRGGYSPPLCSVDLSPVRMA